MDGHGPGLQEVNPRVADWVLSSDYRVGWVPRSEPVQS